MFPRLTALLAELNLPGDWPRLLRGHAVSRGEDDACDLARLVAGWVAEAAHVAAPRGGWDLPHARPPGMVCGAEAPPPTAAYWWCGTAPNGRPHMGLCGPKKKPPAWATLWTTEGLGHWVWFSARPVPEAEAAKADTLFLGGEEDEHAGADTTGRREDLDRRGHLGHRDRDRPGEGPAGH